MDPSHGSLFIAHGDAVTVIDLAHGNAVHSLGEIKHGHAVVPLKGTQKLALTSGHDATVRLYDVASGKELASVAVSADPDAAIIDPKTGHLLTMNADAGKVTEVDLPNARIVREIPLKPGLEFSVIGPDRTLFVNNEDESEIETVDLATGAVGNAVTLPGCKGPTGLALDKPHDRLISACANGVAEIVDTKTHKVVQKLTIGQGPDDALIDTARHLALIPCGRSGTLDVFSTAGREVRKLASVSTEIGARTGAIDPRTGTIYLTTARFGPPHRPGARSEAIPGSFHVLVMKPALGA